MAVFKYKALDAEGNKREGTIDAPSIDLAISALQRRGLIIAAIDPENEKKKLGLKTGIAIFDRVAPSDIVMISRQMTTLFEAQVSALRAFRLLAAEARTEKLATILNTVANDIQGGSAISAALSNHPQVFSAFYVNMVKAGEESGKLDETFSFLADYLDRNYEVASKAKNALIYPAFIIITFGIVMTLMMTLVIPNLAKMLTESGQAVPIYTQIVIGISLFMKNYFIFLFIGFIGGCFALIRYAQTEKGKLVIAQARLEMPGVGDVYKKVFLSRIADNLSTMLRSGIQVLRALEITGDVVQDPIYQKVLADAAVDVKGGMPLSDAFRKHEEIPGIIVAMVKIGEETGNMSEILSTMAKFYRREVNNAVDTLVGLIEPFIIVILAVGVAVLLASVLMPIYNIATSF
ncbi:type II secretion system F family protein [Candidatus Parcubacteria bacterium]|nr:MAG: type II secretion system F family protein [Candidatus Parcubacteria bacterium]